ncbi:protein ECT2 isoform X3 [Vespula pensylvanica]|uniref:protein ECT2 isoform X3 n=1 Tax=Vespula pensylvanica TaxID=30213 RepID=UPI001CB9D9EB|nr:protein ECT2 isoform X3 [Vespula pensylvanica]
MEEQSVHSSISDINSEEAVRSETLVIPRKKRICLVGTAGDDPALGAAAQQFSVPVLKSETGVEYIEDTAYCTYFILKEFEGPEYDALHKSAHRILGPTALLQLAEKKDSLPSIKRPMYTQAMVGSVVVFTGFRKKDELTRLINMIHNMGGSIRKEMGTKVTHLIANCCGGDKYRYAVIFRVPIMSMSWVTTLWSTRDDVSSYGNNEELITAHKLKPFFGARVCFFGFPEEEKKHMCEVLQQQGGEPTEIDDPNCTHVVTELGSQQNKKSNTENNGLLYKTNSSNVTSSYPTEFSPFSFIFYNPYINAIPNIMPIDSAYYILNNKNIIQSESKHYNKWVPSSNLSSTHKYFNMKENYISENINQDSDIYMDDNFSDTQTLSSQSDTISSESFSSMQTDSGIDMSVSSKDGLEITTSSHTFKKIRSFSLPVIYKVACDPNMQDVISKTELSTNQNVIKENFKNLENKSVCFRSSTLNKNKTKLLVCVPEVIEEVEPYQSAQFDHSTILNKKVKKRRYRNWTKSKSCNTIYKGASSNRSHFRKICSYPNLFRQHDSDLSDSLLYDSPIPKKKNKKCFYSPKKSPTIFSKFRDLNFSPMLKKYVLNNSTIEQSQPRQKYTPLPSSPIIPTKIAKLSQSKHIPTSDFEQQGKLSNCPFKSSVLKDAKTKKQEDESLLVVVDESNVNTLPDLASVKAHVVKAEWFWTSVQDEGAADEKDYLFENYLESVLSPTASVRRDSQQTATPSTASTRRKRKRLAETLSSLVQNGTDSPAVHKRRSSVSDAGHLSVSGSFLDCTASPDKQLLDDIPEVEAVNAESTRKNRSPRHQVFLELVQTESNYVGILSTIMTLFKSPLEDLIESSGELVNSTEVKIIFGNFPPIYEVHKKMLEELRYSATYWTEDVSIGNIFLKFAPDLVKAYPPYVNFFENTKEMLDQCDQNKPRFHAFLKICQTKPECGRQSLKELLIKPVQRLPSISLLLNDILKHTSKSNPDYSALELSISSIKEVMTYINEDKRKTEGQLAMFDIFNEIDNCPPHLVSSHRSFIGKCDVMELSEGLSGRGDHLVLFLFTDILEICKKRSKAFNSLKSPNTANGLHSAKLSQGKPYKHIKMLSLSTIRKVVDIRETEECQKVFALMVRSNQELKEKLFSFTIIDEDVNKTNYLRTLCRQMANTVCKADADTFLISLDSHQLEIDTSDVALGTLSKAFKSLFHNFYLEYMDPYVFLLNSMCETTLHVPLPFASRTRRKVGRAFSFNKTPSKLKRAMSTMMSPFGSTNSLTPASQQLAQMRLASCNNINELGNGGSDSPTRDDVLVAPMSVQPTRKAKCSSLSMASLRS